MRYFLEIAYKGTLYKGWQVQNNVPTVQGAIEKALSKLLGTPTELTGSGRTDTGVHATQQFAHFDYPTAGKVWDKTEILHRLNVMVPHDITIQNVIEVHENAHARFDAIERSYEYRVYTRKSPFLRGLAYLFLPEVDLEAMNEAAGKLLAYEDFESFNKKGSDPKHFICNLQRAEWLRTEVGYTFHITANRFLYGMVRALVGTLLEVGAGKLSIADFETIIQRKNRQAAKRSAPPDGLFLSRVRYPYL